MKIEQRKWSLPTGWTSPAAGNGAGTAELVLVFGATDVLRKPELLAAIRQDYPAAQLFGCSTAGEICGTQVSDDSLTVTAVRFAHTHLRSVHATLSDAKGSFQAGQLLAEALASPNHNGEGADPLVHVLVLSDGLQVNGTELVAGLVQHLPSGVTVTGGLAGDGTRFGETLVLADNVAGKNIVTALGLYGRHLKVGFGSLGGWDPFGPERLVTKAKANVLYELDGHSALGLYKQYLGEHAKGLPATGLLFPLSIRTRPGEKPVVRTILSVDEAAQSLTFAGDIPEGAFARLMKANLDRLVDGATGAAQAGRQGLGTPKPSLALLVSCVGRKLVLRQRVEEEVEAVREVLGDAVLTGFYSYGEISPFAAGARCELHNQTMTITTFAEE